jgi:hypothetical protein
MGKKIYVYSFIGDGWNSEFSETKRKAISQAKARWKDHPNLKINEQSFRVYNEREYKVLLSLFD